MAGPLNRLGHVPALDGVRGVAILAVLGYHFTGWPRAGFFGVDLFFVLSGFLITTLLLEERDRYGRVSLRAFYGRRARRLLPAVVAMLTVAALVGSLVYSPGRDAAIVAAGLFYVANVVRAFAHPDPLGATPVDHLWSLSQEEQFYALWPPLLILAGRRLTERRIGLLLFGLFIAVSAYRAGLAVSGASWMRLYYGPDTHAAGLLLGCAAAVARRHGFTITPAAAWLALAAFPAAAFVGRLDGGWVGYALPLVEAAAAGVVLGALGPLARLLAARPLVYLGKVSYSLYVWHQFARWLTGWQHPLPAFALTVALTLASYYLIEAPFRRAKVPAVAPAAAV